LSSDRKLLLWVGILAAFVAGFAAALVYSGQLSQQASEPLAPQLPTKVGQGALKCLSVEKPIADQFGNNHDPVYLPGNGEGAFEHYLVIGHEEGIQHLYGSNSLGPNGSDWTLITDDLFVSEYHELDDGLLIDGVYYIFKDGKIFTYSGDIAKSSRQWQITGSTPNYLRDIGVYRDGDTIHIYGEYGDFEFGYDGLSLGYIKTDTSFADFELVSTKIIDPNTKLGGQWGIGDPTIFVSETKVYVAADLEGKDIPYRVSLWESSSFEKPFSFAGILAQADPPSAKSYKNHRVQDAEFVPAGEGTILMFANWRDEDGDPGKALPKFSEDWTRVVGGYTCRL